MSLNEFLNLTDKIMDEMIRSLDDHLFIELFNALTYPDNWICEMEFLDEIAAGWEPTYLLARAFYGDINPNHEYFQFDGYGNLVSFNYLDDKIDELISDIKILNDDQLETMYQFITNNTEA